MGLPEVKEAGSNCLRRKLIQKWHGVLPGRFGVELPWQIKCGYDTEDMQRDAEPVASACRVRSRR